MPKLKGSPKTGGRQKGVPNKRTDQISHEDRLKQLENAANGTGEQSDEQQSDE